MRTKPPGITRQPSRSRARNSRRMNGRGSSLPLFQTGMVESVDRLLRDEIDAAVARSLLARASRAPASSAAPMTPSPTPSPARDRRQMPARSPSRRGCSIAPRCARRRRRATRSRHSASRGRGRARPAPAPAGSSACARASTTPEPSALAITTLPSRTACTRPGTPSRERAFSSSGSAKSASRRRNSTSARLQAGHGADEHAVVAHREVLALDQQEAEIAREIGVLEIGLVHRAGRQHADAGVVLVDER